MLDIFKLVRLHLLFNYGGDMKLKLHLLKMSKNKPVKKHNSKELGLNWWDYLYNDATF